MFNKIALIGAGVIGGSLVMAARNAMPDIRITAYDKNSKELDKGLELGILDEIASSVVDAADGADLVILATPVGSFHTIFRQLKDVWSGSALYTDVGSTKQSLLDDVQAVFGKIPANLVPAHPIAGSEKSGIAASQSDMFQHRRVILTPVSDTDEVALAKISAFWTSLGAEISVMPPRHHDQILAATSHLPHMLAFTLVDMLGKNPASDEILLYAAGGFRDFTRIASSDPQMWIDICRANNGAIRELITEYIAGLEQVRDLLEQKDEGLEGLRHIFRHAQDTRQKFITQFEQ